MYFEVTRKALMTPLKMIASVVERKQAVLILSQLLLQVDGDQLTLTATDGEIELKYHMAIGNGQAGAVTLPALKLYDICRALGDSAIISIRQQQQQAVVQSGRSRFVLQSLLVADFPSNEGFINETEINLSQNSLRYFLSKTQFAIAQQDARPALNGLLIEIKDQRLNFVATDGFRLAFASEIFIENQLVNNRILLPRKTVLELLKILNNSEEMVKIQLNQQQVRFSLPDLRLTSRLIDRPYPDYEVILAHQASAIITLDCQQFKQILQRVAILYDEQYKGARLEFSPNLLKVSASNPEHEQAFDEMDIDYNGDNFEVGFNVMYLLDALACIDTAKVQLHISGVYSSYLLCPQDSQNPQYAIMPMRL